MKTTTFFRTLLLVLLMAAAGGTFFSCEKPEEPTQEQPQTPSATITTSDVDIQGTWECISPTWGEEYGLFVIFYSNTYEVEAYYPSEQVSFFQSGERGNYIINDSLFYMWHVTRWANFTVVPFPEELPPMFDVSLQDDILTLTYKYSQIAYIGPSVPPRTYIFRKR